VTDTVVVVANGFTRDNVRLQPWRYIFELAKHKSKSNKVFVLTEGGTDAAIDLWEEGFTVVETRLQQNYGGAPRQEALRFILF